MLTPKYLVQTEGELTHWFETETEVFSYIDALALEMRERGVLRVDEWVHDMKHCYCSTLYNRYPDIIIEIC